MTSARERALRRNAGLPEEEPGEPGQTPQPAQPSPRLARGGAKPVAPYSRDMERPQAWELVKGDVIRDPHRKGSARARVLAVHTWERGLITIDFQPVRRDGTEINAEPGRTTFKTAQQVRLFESALPTPESGLIPNDGTTTVPTTTKHTESREAHMAGRTVTRSGAKGAAKGNKTATTTAANTNGGTKRTRRTAEDIAPLVPQFVKHLKGGGKMKELKAEHGFSDDGPIRVAMFRAGFDSKGNEHGIEEGDWTGLSAAKLRDKLVAARSEGDGWYVLAYRSGKTEAECRRIVEEAGGPTGRVYREPAPKPAKADKPAAAKSGGSTGRKVTRKATPADPSAQA